MSGLFRKKKRFHQEERPQAPIPAPLATPAQSEVPAPLPVLESPVAVDPAPVAPAPVASPWPPGSYEFPAAGSGSWYVPIPGGTAGPFKRPEEYAEWVDAVKRRDKNLHEADRILANTYYEGPFPADSFIHGPGEGADAAFIYAASVIYRDSNDAKGKYNTNLFHQAGLFSGYHAAISRLINYGEQEFIFTHMGVQQAVDSYPDNELKRAVLAAFNK